MRTSVCSLLALGFVFTLSLPAEAGRGGRGGGGGGGGGGGAADLQTTLSMPVALDVYSQGRHAVRVDNVGDKSASDVRITLQLPETGTSPTVHVLGVVGGTSSACSVSGTQVVCDVGRVRSGQSASVWVDVALPWSAAPLAFEASASTTSAESSQSNNTDADVADLVYVAEAVDAPVLAQVRHCTGQDLTAFFECTLYPSSMSGHAVDLAGDGSLSFPGQPGYGGTWSQPTADSLEMTYTSNGQIVAEFSGNGVGGGCFEGLTTFPGSAWVSPYEVCLP